jgi:AcrR family transcriptional regulator
MDQLIPMVPPPDSRTAILDAAQRLFAAQGFAATTIKQIGTEAGVNSALLYYYFADKESVYREVLGRLVSSLVAAGLQAFERSHSPAEAVRALVIAQTTFFAANPDMPRLIARELIDHGAAHATEHFTRIAANLFTRLCETIREGQRDGAFRGDLDPQFAAISTVAQVVYFNLARPAVGILLGHGPGGVPPETVRAYGAHAADFALAALTSTGAPRTSASRTSASRTSAAQASAPGRPRPTPAGGKRPTGKTIR